MSVDEKLAFELFAHLVGQSLHVDYPNGAADAPPEVCPQPSYVDIAELAFKAAHAFELVRARREQEQLASSSS